MGRKKKGNKTTSYQEEEIANDFDPNFIPASILQEEEEERQRLEESAKKETPIIPQTPANEPQAKKKTVKQKRMEKQLQQQKMIEKQIKNEKKKTPNLREEELATLSSLLLPLGLKIKAINPDGNCLYNSIIDQFKIQNQKYETRELRSIAAKYLREHPDDFMPFLEEDGVPFSSEQYAKWCDEVENTNSWGGEVEIQAISKALEIPITIYSSNSNHSYGSPDFDHKQALILTYHKHYYALGAHYNSVEAIVK